MRLVRFGLQCDKLGPIEQPASFAATSTKAEINPILGSVACIELVSQISARLTDPDAAKPASQAQTRMK
jgi:hypothetical protein